MQRHGSLTLGTLCLLKLPESCSSTPWTGIKSPLDDAIARHEQVDMSEYATLDEIPFDFERRRSSVVVVRGD
jgi:hypothetical protein